VVVPWPIVRVKSSVPVLAVDQAAVTFVRAPWGVADVGATISSPQVPSGQPFAALAPAEPRSPVERLPASTFTAAGGIATLRAWKDAARTSLLVGRIAPAADGTWPRAALPGAEDLATVYLTAVDDAGNESAAVGLVNAEWIATAGRPAAGVSPHAVHASYYASGAQVPAPAVSEPVSTDGPLLALEQRAHTALRPRFAATGAAPSARTDFLLAFDAARGRTVLYGGLGPGAEALSDTWEWDGVSWADVTPASGYGPHPAARGAMAYDAARGRVALLDGAGQLWEWDGAAWAQRNALGSCADPRGLVAYDAVRERVVAVPFFDTPYVSTCEWDGAAWSTAAFGADPPRFREDAAIAYDAGRGVLVRYGGHDYGAWPHVPVDELWERAGTTWAPVAQPGAAPGARTGSALAYDTSTRRVLLFGGADASATLHADVRTWDGASWAVRSPSGDAPSPRRKAGAVFDAVRARLVVHGGVGAGDAILRDTWELGPDGWEEVTAGRTSPPPRRSAAMAYDPVRQVLVLHGGLADSYHLDTWEYDGRSWREVTPPAGSPSPGARSGHAMAFHSASGKLLLFGGWRPGIGPLNDLWEWTGSDWIDRTPATSPPARYGAGLSEDPARGVLVLLGGYVEVPEHAHPTDHWELSAPAGVLTWTQVASGLPAGLPRAEHAQFHDGTRTLVLGGFQLGAGTLGDVWALENGAWTQHLADPWPGSSAAPDSRGPGAFDLARGRGYVPGDAGQSWNPYRLEWDGSGYAVIRPTSTERWALDERQLPAVALDGRRGRVVVFGGGDWSNRVMGDTWELDADVDAGPGEPVQRRAPAFQFTVRHASAGFSPARVQSLRVIARAGGDAGPSGAGARLLGWHRGGPENPGGRWVMLAQNGDGLALGSSPAGLLEWTATGDERTRYFLERDATLAFQLRPAGAPPRAAAEAAVRAEYLEVRVRYTTVAGPSP